MSSFAKEGDDVFMSLACASVISTTELVYFLFDRGVPAYVCFGYFTVETYFQPL